VNKVRKDIIKVVCIMLCLIFSIVSTTVSASPTKYNEDQQIPAKVVEQLVSAMDSQNYDALANLWTRQEQVELISFFNNSDAKANSEGFHAIKSAKLVGLKNIPLKTGISYGVDTTKYVNNIEDANLFYIAVDLTVKKESKYFMNGINYLLVLLVPEEGQWKIALMPQAPIYQLNLNGLGFNDETEQKALQRQNHFVKTGKLINDNGSIIEDLSPSSQQIREERGSEDTIRIFEEDAKLSQLDAIITKADEHTVPSTIKVYLTKSINYTYYGKNAPFANSIDFYYYVKNVLPKEWYYTSSWPDKSLQAGAMAVKMYGWYHVYYAKYPGQGYDVKDNTADQSFEVNSEDSTRCTPAINAVGGIGVDIQSGSSYVLFEVHHIAGSEGPGGQYSGYMWQNGTKYWAQQGKGYTYMCHYYWDKSANEPMHFFYY